MHVTQFETKIFCKYVHAREQCGRCPRRPRRQDRHKDTLWLHVPLILIAYQMFAPKPIIDDLETPSISAWSDLIRGHGARAEDGKMRRHSNLGGACAVRRWNTEGKGEEIKVGESVFRTRSFTVWPPNPFSFLLSGEGWTSSDLWREHMWKWFLN